MITPLGARPGRLLRQPTPAADVFEVWADVARRYKLDPDWTVITGYSMGGIGTFKLAEQFPDLFARAQPTVGDSEDNNMVASLRNIPVLMWNAAADELVPRDLLPADRAGARRHGYRYELDIFSGEHLTLAIHDQYAPAAEFLGTAKVDRNPAHVTYVADPSLDHADLGFVADHAYWLSGVAHARRGSGHRRRVLARLRHRRPGRVRRPSSARARSPAATSARSRSRASTRRGDRRRRSRPADRIDLTATNVSAVTINPKRAGVELQRRPARDERRAADGQPRGLQADGPGAVI